jgi:hypothetical protein
MLSTDTIAVLISLAVLLLATGLFLGLKHYVGGIDSAIFVALLLTPLLIYLFLSGRIQEFSGPGGWGAKFRDIAHASVETTRILVDAEPLQAMTKGPESEIVNRIAALKPNVPNALVLSVGRGSYYVAEVIEKYLQALMQAGPSSYVVFVDANTERFVGSANARQVLAALKNPELAEHFMRDLREGGLRPFAEMGFLVRESLSPDDSNVVALQKLIDTNADALVIVSADGRQLLGVVDRNRLIAKLMLKLAS